MRFFLPRLRDVLFLAIFIGVLILGNPMLNADGDLARHIATGKMILETGKIPITEPFIYPYLGQPYVPHEWLFGVIAYVIQRFLGLAGIVVLSALLIATTFTMLFNRLVIKSGVRIGPFLLVILGAAVSSLHWIARPHLFSMLFLVLWLIWLDRLRERGTLNVLSLSKYLILMLLWANLHAEFIMGILATLAFLVGWIWDTLGSGARESKTGKQLGIILAGSVLVSMINPAGYQPWLRVFNYLGNDYLMSAINETNSPDFHKPEFLFLLGVIILSLVLLALRRNRYPKAELLLLAGTTWMTLSSARNVHLYGIVLPFALLPALDAFDKNEWITQRERVFKKIETTLKPYAGWTLGILFCLIPLFLSTRIPLYQFDPQRFPVAAVDWLDKHPLTDNGFNAFDWGGYLELYGPPGTRVFIDSMADHTGEISQAYFQIMDMEGNWPALLASYQIRWMILPPGTELADSLVAREGWSILYADSTAVILKDN